jgi:hypothetical protein
MTGSTEGRRTAIHDYIEDFHNADAHSLDMCIPVECGLAYNNINIAVGTGELGSCPVAPVTLLSPPTFHSRAAIGVIAHPRLTCSAHRGSLRSWAFTHRGQARPPGQHTKEAPLSRTRSSTKRASRARHALIVAVATCSGLLAGSAALATPALAQGCALQYQQFGGAKVNNCYVSWYNRSAGLTVNATDLFPNLGDELCIQGYIGSSGQTKVWQSCTYGTFGGYYPIENWGDTALVTRVRLESLGYESSNISSFSTYRPGY